MADPVATEVGDEPIDTSKAQRQDPNQSYNGDDAYAAQFAARHGYDLQHGYDINFTSILRPDLSRWDHIEDAQVRAQMKQGDITRQQAAIDWAAGKLPFDKFASYLGQYGTAKLLGCIDISLIHDLGA